MKMEPFLVLARKLLKKVKIKRMKKMKILIILLLSLTSLSLFSQELTKSAVGYKLIKWKQLDALALDDGKLLSWEQHGKSSFIRLYNSELKLEASFSISDNKSFLNSKTTKLLSFQGGYYIIFDGPVKDKKHELYAQEVYLDREVLAHNKTTIGIFETNSLVKGYFEIQDQDARRLLISYHQRITTDYNQKVYVNLLDEKLNSINERVYTFEHKGRLLRKIKYLMLPSNDIVFYGHLYKDNRLASNDECFNKKASTCMLYKISIFKNQDKVQQFKVGDYFISDILLKYTNEQILVGGLYSGYSNRHNTGFFKCKMDVDLVELEKLKRLDFTSEFSAKVNKATFKERENHLLQAKGASFILEKKIKSKIKNNGGLYSYNLIDVEETAKTTNFIISLNYKYSSKQVAFDKINNSLISDQRNNYIESDVIYFKTDFNKITNYQQIPRFNVTKSSKEHKKPTVLLSTYKGNMYLSFLEIGKYTLLEKVKDDYTFSNVTTVDYGLEYKKRGNSFMFSPSSKSMYSYIKENRRVRIIKVN